MEGTINTVEEQNIEKIVEEQNPEEKKRKRKWILLLLLLLLLLFTGYKMYQNYLERASQVQSGSLGEIGHGIMPGMSPEEIQQYLNEKADKSKFTINVNSHLEFDNAKSKAYLRLINGKNSAYAIKFTIRLEDSNKVIYKSSLVKPEQYIEYIKLSKKLKKGTYRAIGTYEFYDLTHTDIKVSEQEVVLNIEVKN